MSRKILLVEDTIDALVNLRDLLKMEGFEVITAENGSEAMYKFYLYTPDIIMTDLRMPKMDGFALIERIKKSDELRDIPIIVFSASATPENERKSLALGADLFLKKPCPTEVLLKSIYRLLGDEAAGDSAHRDS
ncbi:MAG TPA: response regulator [Chryseolinea sp.]|nr:response regulator [Chryseolinea sp.]